MYKSIEEILKILKNGNQRFIDDKEKNYNFIQTRKRLIKKQDPFVIILSCSDSRVTPEIIFNTNLNEIFNIRIAGNIVNEDILESIQYTLNEFNCSTVIILGHENCGAIQMTIDGIDNDITQKIKKVIEESDDKDTIIDKNIQQSVDEIKNYLEENGILNKFVIGAKYSLKSGKVKFLDGEEK